jgi:catechol 2,3-dioxygenase-like lactoylglutathione lyase family enzyme
LEIDMPALTGVLETALYVDDLDRASRFYEELFGLTRIAGDHRLRAYSVAGRSVLLLFKRGASNCVTQLPFGTLGPHDGSGPLHMAFAMPAEDLAEWEQKLTAHAITVETRIQWPRGGTSLYFRDPDQNLLELATPGIWSIY